MQESQGNKFFKPPVTFQHSNGAIDIAKGHETASVVTVSGFELPLSPSGRCYFPHTAITSWSLYGSGRGMGSLSSLVVIKKESYNREAVFQERCRRFVLVVNHPVVVS